MSDVTVQGCPAVRRVGCVLAAGHLGLHRSADDYWWEGDTPTPAPALTDEQITRMDAFADELRLMLRLSVAPGSEADADEAFDSWLAAVIARAKREAAEEIERAIDVEYGHAAHDDHLSNAFREGVIEGLTRALLIVRATR